MSAEGISVDLTKIEVVINWKASRSVTEVRNFLSLSNPTPRLNVKQHILEGPAITQGRLKAPMPEAQLYAYTNADVMASTSSVMEGQTSLYSYEVYTLFDSGASHSLISTKLALSLSNSSNRTSNS